MSKTVLKLFIIGKSPRAEKMLANLHRVCEEELEGGYELIVINVIERPQLAEDEKIFATPTLIKKLPPPVRRIIGYLSSKEKVLLGLDLVH